MITEYNSAPVAYTPIINTADMLSIAEDRCLQLREMFDADEMIQEALCEIIALEKDLA
ncbi:hypothetical protein [Desulfogranum marinum]|uniref:hypothetical protein n=1 Tax=Desulfogranum marinum TaxID=453220 RepID=UPI001965775F|nr:hypothetical protein [Desulfogranum marinum]MBM9515294.1 hypothetical protein [Desulfogranum marinum]